jgi:hypothetical protein
VTRKSFCGNPLGLSASTVSEQEPASWYEHRRYLREYDAVLVFQDGLAEHSLFGPTQAAQAEVVPDDVEWLRTSNRDPRKVGHDPSFPGAI